MIERYAESIMKENREVMDFIKEKIRVMTKKLEVCKSLRKETVDYFYVECPEYKTNNIPPGK